MLNKHDKKGQLGIFDAILFFIIIIIASSVLFIYSLTSVQETGVRSRMLSYTDNTMTVLMRSTVNGTWYIDKSGNNISKPPGNTNIQYLLLEEFSLQDDGVPANNFTGGYEKNIKTIAENLIHPDYHYALHATYTNTTSGRVYTVFISDSINDLSKLPDERFSSSVSIPMINDKSGEVQIALYIWRS